MHPRKKIRRIVAGRLAADQRIAPRVDVGRVVSVGKTKLPRVGVYTGLDRLLSFSDSPRIERRSVELRVELQAEADSTEASQDWLDDLAEVVEQVVLEDERHLEVAERTDYRETLVQASDEGDRVIVGLVLVFDVSYPRSYDERELGDATGMDVGIDIESETPGQVEAQATVDLETI